MVFHSIACPVSQQRTNVDGQVSVHDGSALCDRHGTILVGLLDAVMCSSFNDKDTSLQKKP